MRWTWQRVVKVGAGAVITFWLLGPLLIFLFGRYLFGSTDVASFGAAGDMFGVSTAFFSGLGLLGVAVVLYYDMQERRRDLLDRQESRRPLLLSDVNPTGAILTRAVGGAFPEIAFTVDLDISNATHDPALNISVEIDCPSGNPALRASPLLIRNPIAGGLGANTQIRLTADGPQAQEILSTVAGEGSIAFCVRVSYDSLSEVRWESGVSYGISSRPVDRATLMKIRDGDQTASINTGVGSLSGGLPFNVKPEDRSWYQRRVPVS